MTLIDTGARRIFTETAPVTPGLPWVVCSNSLITDLRLWDPQMAALDGRCNVLRYDQHGHGRSPAASASLTIDDLAGDLIAVIDAHGLRDVTLLGVSMGVPTGLAACGKRPDLFARLVLVNGQVQSSPDGQAVWAQRIAAAECDFAGFCDGTMRRWLSPEVADSPAGAALLAMMKATSFQGFATCAAALGDFDCRESLDRLAIPVLAVAGANDTALLGHMQAVFPGRPDTRFEVITGAGHLANYESPGAFNALLAGFLQ